LVRVDLKFKRGIYSGEQSEYVGFIYAMPVRFCRVTIKDMDGVKHTVEVTAETLYEAVALGLVAIRGNDWVMGIAQGLNTVHVSVMDIPIEHLVKIKDFHDWLKRNTGAPRNFQTHAHQSHPRLAHRQIKISLTSLRANYFLPFAQIFVIVGRAHINDAKKHRCRLIPRCLHTI
jgi:hypothetical protein